MGTPSLSFDAIHPYLIPPFVVGLWLTIGALMRTGAGFSWRTSRAWGREPCRASQTGVSARIGMITLGNCLNIYRVRGGFILQLSWIFLGGSRYVPDAEISAVESSRSSLGTPRLTCALADGKATFHGEGAEFLRRHLPSQGDDVLAPPPVEPRPLPDRWPSGQFRAG